MKNMKLSHVDFKVFALEFSILLLWDTWNKMKPATNYHTCGAKTLVAILCEVTCCQERTIILAKPQEHYNKIIIYYFWSWSILDPSNYLIY